MVYFPLSLGHCVAYSTGRAPSVLSDSTVTVEMNGPPHSPFHIPPFLIVDSKKHLNAA